MTDHKPIRGYDGFPIHIGDRIELHPGLDLWMQGARFGVIRTLSPGTGTVPLVTVQLDRKRRPIAVHADRVRKVA